MPTLALNIRMHGKLAVVIGGGTVALRKLRTLLRAGASVTVVAVNISPEIAALKDAGAFAVRIGRYESTDLDNVFFAIAATDDATVNEQISADARERGILAVVADNPAAGDCIFPAMLQRGDLEIAVSTGGRCPTFAADVRDCIAEHIGDEYGAILAQLAGEREKLLTNCSSGTYNRNVLRSLARRLLAEPTERKESLP
ncbi:MAG: bifunctional precorrin-2 dehydrogenase/sirohydrochlorin ferrochelatase [Desulfuromonadaceae bacterium]|nr:bifunctional precorrin-2 dehydrogenase/sirohydrochlorin ferrochelatase [Desulfuromonadaceae bacterium]